MNQDNLRRATEADLPALVEIHKAAYSSKHFTTLFPDQLLASYYRYFLGDNLEILVALKSNPEKPDISAQSSVIEGFAVFGAGIPRRIASFKKDHMADILILSLRHPFMAARKIAGSLRSRFEGRGPTRSADCLLLSIAAGVPRKGIGKRLLSAMIARARTAGFQTLGLFVKTDNIGAINAYFDAGFVIVSYVSDQFYMERSLRSV